MNGTTRVLLTLTATVVVPVSVAGRQPPPLDKPFDLDRRVFLDVNQVAPVEVVGQLAAVVGARSDGALALGETPVTLRLWNVRARVALDAFCDVVGCRWQASGRTLRFTSGTPPPPIPRSAEFLARLNKPLEGDHWKFVRAPLREVAAALTQAVGAQVVFQDTNPDTAVTVDLTGVTPYRAMFNVMLAIGWDTRGVGWEMSGSGGAIVLRGHGWKDFDTNPPQRAASDRVHKYGEAGLVMPRPISMPKPAYSRDAVQAKIQGNVSVSAVVEKDGTVGGVSVVQSLDPGLDAEAVRAARMWRFEPGRKDGKPVPVQVTLEMTFTLK